MSSLLRIDQLGSVRLSFVQILIVGKVWVGDSFGLKLTNGLRVHELQGTHSLFVSKFDRYRTAPRYHAVA